MIRQVVPFVALSLGSHALEEEALYRDSALQNSTQQLEQAVLLHVNIIHKLNYDYNGIIIVITTISS